ncbi:MAG: hypothetical protein RLZZ247_1517 [Cyanobacteriota bacterium]
MRPRPPAALAAALLTLLALPQPAQAQGLSALRAQAQRCLQGAQAASSCKPFLETSHRLKNRAEASKSWRCYTALLGYEAQVMASRALTAAPPEEAGYGELAGECPALR